MKISVITVNRNHLEGLQKTFQSIVAQTYKDWEWIVIDGGSTEGDRDFIEVHQAQIAYWCSEPDKGPYNAMNKALQHATGDYLVFMNSGDTFHDSSVLEQVFSQPRQADILYGDWMEAYLDGRQKRKRAPEDISLHFFCRDNICHQAMFIKRQVMQQSPYDERYRLFADWAKWIEFTLQGYIFQYVSVVVCDFEMGGISNSMIQQQAKEREMLFSQNFSPAVSATLTYLSTIHPLSIEANRLINKKKLYKKIIHMAIRLIHLFEH
ncbi:MAG: glycosyltransferase [Prevotella sp.]|nr:glycosyltransferase [Prevotella sp.]